MALVGTQAPLFNAPAVIDGKIVNDFSLDQYLGKKEILLFFYPKDFTFVCPTELLDLQKNISAFEQRDVVVIACSTDTAETHHAWLNTPIERGGIPGVTFPLVADHSKVISANFDVLAGMWDYDEEDELTFIGEPVAYRGTFLIDKEGVVRYESINDLPLGRSVEEILRVIDMWQFVRDNGEYCCPMNWKPGKEVIQPNSASISSYLSKNQYDAEEQQWGVCCQGKPSCHCGKLDCEQCTPPEENFCDIDGHNNNKVCKCGRSNCTCCCCG